MVRVEILCKNEGKTVGEVTVEAPASLDAAVIKRQQKKPRRGVCRLKKINDGEQMFCSHCGGALWFKTNAGEFPAVPGSLKIEG